MKKKTVAKPSGRRTLAAGAAVAAMVPLALATILPAALNGSKGDGKAPKPSVVAFQPDCRLPFDSIKTPDLDVDASCTLDGNAGTDTAKRLENNAKNNFCVKGEPTPITYDDLKGLQQAADNIDGLKGDERQAEIVSSTYSRPPATGSWARVLWCSLCRLSWMLTLSNVGKGKGENVNCKLPTKDDNDIHIELTKSLADDDPCNSVTAEMSPHFRPEIWSELVPLKKFATPVRITEPLFFDDSHQPCRDGVGQIQENFGVGNSSCLSNRGLHGERKNAGCLQHRK